MLLDHLEKVNLMTLEKMGAMTTTGKRIRAAGVPCKFVFGTWPASESDIRFKGEAVEFAIYTDHHDKPHTACFVEDEALVSEGW